MAKVTIKRKCVMVARNAARKSSMSRETGTSVFIKRCYGSYRLIAVMVSDKQRSCRDLFAEAQKMASRELKMWNKKRHWERMARKHKIRGAHRMAVSWFYGMLKANGGVMVERVKEREESVRNTWYKAVCFDSCSAEGESRMMWEKKSRRRAGEVRRWESGEDLGRNMHRSCKRVEKYAYLPIKSIEKYAC